MPVSTAAPTPINSTPGSPKRPPPPPSPRSSTNTSRLAGSPLDLPTVVIGAQRSEHRIENTVLIGVHEGRQHRHFQIRAGDIGVGDHRHRRRSHDHRFEHHRAAEVTTTHRPPRCGLVGAQDQQHDRAPQPHLQTRAADAPPAGNPGAWHDLERDRTPAHLPLRPRGAGPCPGTARSDRARQALGAHRTEFPARGADRRARPDRARPLIMGGAVEFRCQCAGAVRPAGGRRR